MSSLEPDLDDPLAQPHLGGDLLEHLAAGVALLLVLLVQVVQLLGQDRRPQPLVPVPAAPAPAVAHGALAVPVVQIAVVGELPLARGGGAPDAVIVLWWVDAELLSSPPLSRSHVNVPQLQMSNYMS